MSFLLQFNRRHLKMMQCPGVLETDWENGSMNEENRWPLSPSGGHKFTLHQH